MKTVLPLVAALLAFLPASAVAQTVHAGPPFATGLNKFFGGINSTAQSPNLTSYFNQVTPENAGKWGSVEGTRDVMNWTELDAAYQLAKENNFVFRCHVLVWGAQQPAWMRNLPPAEQLEELEEWFAAVAARYPAIDYLEVVNEPTNDPPDASVPGNATDANCGNYINALGGAGTTGWDWVRNAFRMARLYFPASTKLMLNEYSITNDTNRMNRYIQIVNILKAEDLIDAVGVQAHYFSTKSYSGDLQATSAQTKANLDLLAATGVRIMVTEMDIDAGTSAAPDEAAQLSEYQRIFPIFWEHPSLIGMTLWGYRPGMWRDSAYLVRTDGSERPALQWLKTYLMADRLAVGGLPRAQSAAQGGTVTLTAGANGSPTPSLTWQRNGALVAAATSATLTLNSLQPADTGLYTAVATSGGVSASSKPSIVGINTTSKVIGTGVEVNSNVRHPNGKYYDQVLVTGPAEAITAEYSADPAANQVTRTSFIDTNGDIVQVEFAGPGTLSLVLEAAGTPATPEKYNQPGTSYVKGHAGIVITGATEDTNVSVFTVGRATAFDPAPPEQDPYDITKQPHPVTNNPAKNHSPLFIGHANTEYDGVADIAFIAIASANGKFGGIRTANARYTGTHGFVGVYAPGVQFTGPVFIGEIAADEDAKPVIILGSAIGPTAITGGALDQLNDAPVEVSGVATLEFRAGQDSHGRALNRQTNLAVLKDYGRDITAEIVVYPPGM